MIAIIDGGCKKKKDYSTDLVVVLFDERIKKPYATANFRFGSGFFSV